MMYWNIRLTLVSNLTESDDCMKNLRALDYEKIYITFQM